MPGEFDQRRVVEGNGSATNRAAASANPMCCSFTVVRGSSASCPGSTLWGDRVASTNSGIFMLSNRILGPFFVFRVLCRVRVRAERLFDRNVSGKSFVRDGLWEISVGTTSFKPSVVAHAIDKSHPHIN